MAKTLGVSGTARKMLAAQGKIDHLPQAAGFMPEPRGGPRAPDVACLQEHFLRSPSVLTKMKTPTAWPFFPLQSL